jgi:pimeloyl-ACP methyl ester carboxylesterase
MKYFFLTFILLLTLSTARSQNKTANDAFAAKFISYYNSGQADSLYAMFSDEVKQAMPLKRLGLFLQQYKGFGNLIKSEYVGKYQNMDGYMGTFEKSEFVLYLSFNKANKIVGFNIRPDKRKLSEPGTVTVKTATAILKGTLSVPDVTQKIPVVLLIAGSGLTDRNGNSMLANIKPNYLKLISEALKLKNIAVLRYDKLGSGQSTTTKAPADITFNDMVDDASAFIEMLKADKRFSKVIVAGHSEGSLVGILASEREKPDAFISLSGTGFPIDNILKTQIKAMTSAYNYNKAALIIDSIKTGKTVKQMLDPGFDILFDLSLQPYLYSWMRYDPRQEIAKLNMPLLIVQGTNDIQVNPANAQQLKKSAPKAQLKLIPGMSHILKEAPADIQQNMATYNMPDLPLHPALIPVLTEFIDGLK